MYRVRKVARAIALSLVARCELELSERTFFFSSLEDKRITTTKDLAFSNPFDAKNPLGS